MIRYVLFWVLFTATSAMTWAQSNDECIGAIELDDLTNWCSGQGAFNNNAATQSIVPSPTCFPQTTFHDVWFTFVAQATTVNISVSGNAGATPGGTILRPQFALYEGECQNLTEVACDDDNLSYQIAERVIGALTIGQRYYIRVAARNGNRGTFELCVNNFNDVPQPKGDCPTAVVLCDKSAFTVQNVSGIGIIPNEIDGNTCATTPSCRDNIGEQSSSWYKWVCKESGSLTFDITPVNPSDDIDFVLFELPNGIDDCSGKRSIRCMFSGEILNQPLSQWIACTGTTGISNNANDESEDCGCDPGDDNYVRVVNMEAGKAYALYISNFSETGKGFSIAFGGTGTFEGPQAAISLDPASSCFGVGAFFSDASTYASGDIVKWRWDFGSGATPRFANTPTVAGVQWTTPGTKTIVLTIETENGCLVTTIENFEIEACCEDVNRIVATLQASELLCWYDADATIDVNPTGNAAPFTYAWSTGAITQDITGLSAGIYTLTISNAAGCQDSFEVEVEARSQIVPEFIIEKPTCNGGQDGSLTVIPDGGEAPYQFSFDNGAFSSDNFIGQLPIGTVNIRIRDALNCELDTNVFVNELVLELDTLQETIVPPTCFGLADGSITIHIANGQPPYEFDFMDGNGFVTNNTIGGLPDTTITVQVRDANNCMGSFVIAVTEPPLLRVEVSADSVRCFGEMNGLALAQPQGGVGGYGYAWSNGVSDSLNSGLDTGWYALTVTDANGCTAEASVQISQPPLLKIDEVTAEDVRCFTDSNGVIRISALGGSPTYLYYVSGGAPVLDTIIGNLRPGAYWAFVEDANGCRDSARTVIGSPPPLIVDAGVDQTVDLGYHALLRSELQPFGWPVSYSWSPANGSLDCADCEDPLSLPPRTTTYTLMVTDSNGCVSVDSVTIFVNVVRPVHIPNVFSPNGDGANDFFYLIGGPAATQVDELVVFNRWGALVYRVNNVPLNDPMRGWDGTFKNQMVDPGVFVYMATVRFLDDAVVLYKGSITVVR